MAEQPIMWVGRKPGSNKPKTPNPETDEQLSAELTALCEGAGLSVDEYLVAHGNFGSWLLKLTSGSGNERLIWDGKAGQLRYEREISRNEWQEVAADNPGATDRDGLLAAARELVKSA